MRNENKMTKVVAIYVGYSKNMGGFARRSTLLAPTDDSELLLKAILEIYHMYIKDLPIRTIGLNFGGLLESTYQQLNMFEDDKEQIKRRNLQKTMDKLHDKFGKNSVLRASSLLEESTIKDRNNFIGGHRK